MKKAMYRILAAVFLLQATLLETVAAEKIKIATMTWEDLKPISLVTKHVLEKAGYEVEIVEFSEWGIAFVALGRGDVDIMTSQINNVTSDYWNKNKDRLEKLSPISHGLRMGLVVPSYVPVNSIAELNSIKDKVNGTIVGGTPGTGIMRDTNRAVADYGLEYKIIEGSTSAAVAQLASALERKEWIVTTLWEPSWMMMKYDVKFLEDPKGIYGAPQTYYWIAKNGFSSSQSRAREILASMFIPVGEITKINGAIKDGMAMDEAVDAWVIKNEGLTKVWLTYGERKYN